jgi:hypothetical protein
MKVLKISWTQKMPRLKKNKCMFIFQVISNLLEGCPLTSVVFDKILLLVVVGGSWFPLYQWVGTINLIYDLFGQSQRTFHLSCLVEDGLIVFTINQNKNVL